MACAPRSISASAAGGFSVGFEAEHANKKPRNPLPKLVYSQTWPRRRSYMPTATCIGLH